MPTSPNSSQTTLIGSCADIYADQGITGTSIDKRDDFLRMMEDCRKGRIDRILVKSSSRFARNTKESLAAVRELKSLDISVYFEEQNIDTAQVSGEVLIAMFAALAQRESEAISGTGAVELQSPNEQREIFHLQSALWLSAR
ncbi:MAG: recombinase family protein [Dysosmobacter sp.]